MYTNNNNIIKNEKKLSKAFWFIISGALSLAPLAFIENIAAKVVDDKNWKGANINLVVGIFKGVFAALGIILLVNGLYNSVMAFVKKEEEDENK